MGGAIRASQCIHRHVPVDISAVKKGFDKVRLPVCDIEEHAIGFEDTKHLRGKQRYYMI